MFSEAWAKQTLKKTPLAVVTAAYAVVKQEGGYVDNPNDSGGATNHGISLVTARNYGTQFDYNGDGIVTASDLLYITTDIAAAFFVQEYFYKTNANLLPSCLYPLALDMFVNMGRNAAYIIQHTAIILGAKIVADGIIGASTAASCLKLTQNDNGKSFINLCCSLRVVYYKKLAASNPKDGIFLAGWIKRADSFKIA